jgi:probable phosphoglycerate mutase
MTATTRVLTVRHGQSAWNALGRWQGQADPPLSELGVLQAAAVADVVATIDVDAVVSSDLERARATAVVIADRCGLDSPRVDPRVRERNAGDWTGLTRHEIERHYPGYLDDRRTPPGWEHDDDVIVRAHAALADLRRLHPGGVVLLVTHAGVIRALERRAGLDDALVANLGGRWFEVGAEGIAAGGAVGLLDETKVEVTVPGAL